MLKVAGCLMIFSGCTAAGFFKSLTYKQRTAELSNIFELLKLMYIEILYKRDPLIKTFRNVAELKNSWFSEVLKLCSCWLEKQCPLHEAWQKAVEDKMEECVLHEKDLTVLNDMILGLGKSDIAGQERILESTLLRIEECYKNAQEQERVQGRMCCGMGAAAGAVIAILLI